jgi:hypothetical protein
MTLDEVKRSLACGVWVRGELAQALDAAGVTYPAYLQTASQVEELQGAISAAQAAPSTPTPTGKTKGEKAA